MSSSSAEMFTSGMVTSSVMGILGVNLIWYITRVAVLPSSEGVKDTSIFSLSKTSPLVEFTVTVPM